MIFIIYSCFTLDDQLKDDWADLKSTVIFTMQSFIENHPVPSLKKVEGLEGEKVVHIASGAEHSTLLTGTAI